MHRRTVVALMATVGVAGCTDLLSTDRNTLIDQTFEDGSNAQFSANAGDDVTVDVDVEEVDEGEVDEGEEDVEVETEAVSVQISYDGTPIFAESIEEDSSFELTLEDDGSYNTVVSGGQAHVTIQRE